MDQVLQRLEEIAIAVAPRMARASVNGRHNILITGRIATTCSIAEASLVRGGEVCGRITYGRASAMMESPADPDSGEGGGRRAYDFAFNLMRPLDSVEERIEFSIVAKTDAGGLGRADFALELDPSRPDHAFSQTGHMQENHAAAIQSPMLLYVERADTDGDSRLTIAGWVVSREPILAVQVFHGDDRVGLAKSGLSREDVGNHHAAYPNARNSGFRLALTRTALKPGGPSHGGGHRTFGECLRGHASVVGARADRGGTPNDSSMA
jgi:hypothetical protein